MLYNQRLKILSALTLALALAAVSCGDEDGGPDGNTPEDVLTQGLSTIPQMGEALSRLVLTLQGTPQPGVNITPITDGVQGTLGVDLDDNGSNETTVFGSLVYVDPNVGLAAGATLTITDIDGPGVDGTLSALVQPVSATDVSIGPGSGSFDTGAGPLAVNSISLFIGFGTPTVEVSGLAQFTLDGDVGQISFAEDGQGNLTIALDFQGEIITVP